MFGEFCLGNYRGRLDIIADILDVTSRDAKKTQIMCQANLSYKVLKKYLAELIGASLVSFEAENQQYILTTKGHEFLEAYKEYSRRSKTVEKHLSRVETKRRVLEELCSGDKNPC
jgi:predicted transcriptional regulator